MVMLLQLALVLFLATIAVALLAVPWQRRLLGLPATSGPLLPLRWGGALLANVAGPLLCAKAFVVGLALVSEVLLPADGAGTFAGIGLAWLVLPMALLVIGTGALKLPALASGEPLDTRAVIALADGREWSLLPLALGLAVGVLLLFGGAIACVGGRIEGLFALGAGVALLPWVSARVALRFRSMRAERAACAPG